MSRLIAGRAFLVKPCSAMAAAMPDPLDPQAIARDAHWLAQAYDHGQQLARLVGMTAEDYRAAAFLDDRMFDRQRDVRVLQWDEMTAVAGLTNDARWIFHIGHVGSTMVARMLGEIPGVLSVREPRILRDLAALPVGQAKNMAPEVAALCSRRFERQDFALVKATSFVSEIAPLLLVPGGKAIFMYAGATSYLATILAGENSVMELHALHDYRAGRMADRVPPMADAANSDAHRAAMAWACEMTSLEAAADAMPDREILWLDFDNFLANPTAGLIQAASHCGCTLPPELAETIVTGPLMRRYSKALEYEYSPGLRRELQAEARQQHGRNIVAALDMLKEAAKSSPLLERALARS
jgi:hypothetical protein